MKRSPNYWSVGDTVNVPAKVVHYGFGAVDTAPAQEGRIVSVAPLKVRVDIFANDNREKLVDVKYEWDELS